MCRLFGISYGKKRERVPTEILAAQLFGNLTNGGKHAYGWMVGTDEAVWTQKHYGRADTSGATQNILEFHDSPEGEAIEEKEINWFVGHTRYATTGAPEIMANNHPITHGDVIGVHNGKVYNPSDVLSVTGRSDKVATVDSEAIFAAVDKWGEDGLDKLDMDAVAIYTTMTDVESLILLRTSKRDVTIGFTDRGNIIFASEERAIRALFPFVRIVRYSPVRSFRLLELRGGKIVRRSNLVSPFDDEAYIISEILAGRKPSTEFVKSHARSDFLSLDWTDQNLSDMIFPEDIPPELDDPFKEDEIS